MKEIRPINPEVKQPTGKPAELRVLIADDEPCVCSALRVLLAEQPGVTVVGEIFDGPDLLKWLNTAHADLVLLDWELPGRTGADLLQTLRSLSGSPAIFVLSSQPQVRRKALEAGADDFVSKSEPPERLLAALGNYQTNHYAGLTGNSE